jgi:DNA-binding CsgD family transcriptional regulator
MSIAMAEPGFILLDEHFHPVAFNPAAVAILAYPTKPDRIAIANNIFLTEKIRSNLMLFREQQVPEFVREYRSGERRYICRTYRVECRDSAGSGLSVAMLLERHTSSGDALNALARQFDLTGREQEIVALLLEGLTSKEIANRMHISPNTVKAFLRLVMLKMSVTTRSGIIGKIVGPLS